MKSPLIIGSDASALSAASLAILKNQALISINQDELGQQGTLRAAYTSDGHRAPAVPAPPPPPVPEKQVAGWMAPCTFGTAVAAQRWEISGRRLMQASTQKCLARTAAGAVTVAACDPSAKLQQWDLSRVNSTVSQVRDDEGGLCLTFNSSSLHMEACGTETGDKTTAHDCTQGNCRFSGIIYQLWYLNSLSQMTSAITNIPNGGGTLLPSLPGFPTNTPWCLATAPNAAPAPPPAPPAVDSSMPLQVWAGPLAGGDFVVLLLNTGNGTQEITAHWADIGLKGGVAAKAIDVWTGKDLGTKTGTISASVASHDSAVFRLAPTTLRTDDGAAGRAKQVRWFARDLEVAR